MYLSQLFSICVLLPTDGLELTFSFWWVVFFSDIFTITILLIFYLQVFLTNLSAVNPITVNSKYIETSLRLNHGDVFTIIDRSFRFEALSGKSPIRSPGKSLKNNVFTPVKGSPSKTFGTPKVQLIWLSSFIT